MDPSRLACWCVPDLLAGFAHAADFHVDANLGSDATGNGTAALPWKTLTHALQKSAGQSGAPHRILVAPGKYDAASGEAFPLILPADTVVCGAGADLVTISGAPALPFFQFQLLGNVDPIPGQPSLSGLRLIGPGFGNGRAVSSTGRSLDGLLVEQFELGVVGGSDAAVLSSSFRQCTIGIRASAGAPTYFGSCTVAGTRFEACGIGLELIAYDAHPPFGPTALAANAVGCVFEQCTVAVRQFAESALPVWSALTDLKADSCRITNCGTAIDGSGPNLVGLSGCTLADNLTGIKSGLGYMTLSNTIVWNHAFFAFDPTDVLLSIYSNTPFGLPGPGNLSVDPLFVNAALGDYHLRADSPLIDAGDPGHTAGGLDLDYDPRICDGSWMGLARIDIGADEFDRVRLQASGSANLGASIALKVEAPPGALAACFLSGAAGDLALGALGSLLVNPDQAALLGTGMAPLTTFLNIPNDPLLLGVTAYAQGYGRDLVGPGASLSNRITLFVK